MFAHPNVLAKLSSEIGTIRQCETHHLGETVGQYALLISSVFTLLLAEVKRTAPPTQSAQLSWSYYT